LAYAFAKKGIKTTFVAANVKGAPGLDSIRVDEFLTVIIPAFPISRRIRYRTPLINETYQMWLFPALKKKYKPGNTYVICFDFGAYLLGKYFSKLIYFASDDYINNVKVPFLMNAYTTYTQRRLIETSMIALATARKLVTDFKRYNSKSFELPLGSPDFNVDMDQKEILRDRDGRMKVVLLGFIDRVK